MIAALGLVAGLAAALALPAAAAGAAAGTATVDYLYVESNEGGASGGHVALRIGDRAYDFAHHAPGILRLDRREADEFLYAYAYLQNRPVHVTRLGVSDDEATRLRDRFNGLYLSERARFDALSVLEEDRRLLAALADRNAGSGRPTMDVAGAGYFFSGQGSGPGRPGSSPALVELREQAVRRFGRGWIADRLHDEREALRRLPPDVVGAERLTSRAMQYPRLHDAFSERCRDRLAAIAALEVLAAAPAVRAGVSRALEADDAAIDASVWESLDDLRGHMIGELTDLLTSSRRDWGSVALVGMARLDLLDRSIRNRRLEVLDVFPDDAAVVDASALRDREALAALTVDARKDVDAALERIDPGDHREPDPAVPSARIAEAEWNEVEAAVNRHRELEDAVSSGRPLRVAPGRLVPGRPAARPLPPRRDSETADLADLAAEATRIHDLYAARLHEDLAYRLVGRNCVSELIATMQAAFDDRKFPDASVPEWIDPDDTAARTVPFLSSAALRRSGRAREVRRMPSWREQRLAAAGADRDPQVALRESTTLTATVHRRAPGDSFFVMFADAVALRPLAGAVNLAAAAGAATLGISTLALRGPDPLVAALRGMLFSVPELAFVRIRRGSYAYVGRDDARLPDWW